jgi:RAP domain
LDPFFADYFIPETNTVLECVGPVHYTIFKKRYQGTIELRYRLLEKQGFQLAFIGYEDWLNWKQQNQANENVMKMLKPKDLWEKFLCGSTHED